MRDLFHIGLRQIESSVTSRMVLQNHQMRSRKFQGSFKEISSPTYAVCLAVSKMFKEVLYLEMLFFAGFYNIACGNFLKTGTKLHTNFHQSASKLPKFT